MDNTSVISGTPDIDLLDKFRHFTDQQQDAVKKEHMQNALKTLSDAKGTKDRLQNEKV